MTKGIQLPFRVGVSPTLHIRGIIATEKIAKGTLIERCPAIVYRKHQAADETVFAKYVFDWDETHEALALGYGSLLNHSEERNVEVDYDRETREIIITAMRDILEGEELLISYSDDSTLPVDPDYISFDRDLDN